MPDILARMRQLIGSTAEWTANDIQLGNGEFGVEALGSGAPRLKVGDGLRTWSALPYSSLGGAAEDAPYVMVEWFGAAGNGVTDDSAAFYSALADGRPIALDSRHTYAVKDITIAASSGCPAIYSPGGNANIVPASGSGINTRLFTVTKDSFTFDSLTFTLPISTVDGVRPACDRAIYFDDADDCTVVNCDFIGGRFGPYFGGTCKYFICSGNRITQTYGQAISADSPDSFEIIDNICHVGGYSTADSSGAIRIGGIASQEAIIQNGFIQGNIIRAWNSALDQEAIDLSCQAVRNLLVSGNLLDGCGGGGIELKTGPSGIPNAVYQNVLISDNVIRMLTTGGLGIDLHFSIADAPSKESKIAVSGNRIFSDNLPPAGGPAIYGIYVTSLEDVFITGNAIDNVTEGITLTYDTSTTGINARTTISGNDVRASNRALNLAGASGTIDDLVVQSNRLIATTNDGISATAPVINRATIQGNQIEAGHYGMELRGFNNSRVLNNTIKATGNCIVTQATPVPNGIEIIGNHMSSATTACNIGAGSAIVIMENQVRVPNANRTVSGAGSWIAVHNIRGTASASPAATMAAALGDTWTNDLSASTTIREWVCTSPADAGGATLKAVALA